MKEYTYTTMLDYFYKNAPIKTICKFQKYHNYNIVVNYIKAQIYFNKLNKNDIEEIDNVENITYNIID